MRKMLMLIAILICTLLIGMNDAIAAKYRVEIDIAFNNEQDAVDLLNYVENIKVKTQKSPAKEEFPLPQKSRYHKCTHDEANPVQCKDYINIDFNKEKKVHESKGTQ